MIDCDDGVPRKREGRMAQGEQKCRCVFHDGIFTNFICFCCAFYCISRTSFASCEKMANMANIVFREGECVFSQHFLKMALLAFPKVDFKKNSRCVFLFLHTIARLEPPLYFFWQFSAFMFGRNFGNCAKTLFFFSKNIVFSAKCVYFHIG